ncbi:hypothetical protein GT354_32995, partial [Streptomyces sp. SID3343]|nr:hypothetical protein [Streptomyces sp. SID3343]
VVVAAGATAAAGAVWGEIPTTAAPARGAVGALIEGAVRDVPAVVRLGLRLSALSEATAGPGSGVHVAEVGGLIDIGGASVADGDPILSTAAARWPCGLRTPPRCSPARSRTLGRRLRSWPHRPRACTCRAPPLPSPRR